MAEAVSLGKFNARLALRGDRDAIGSTGARLEGVSPAFTGEAHVTDAADMRKMSENKRLTLLVSFVHTVATGVRDDVVTMFALVWLSRWCLWTSWRAGSCRRFRG